MQQLGWLPFLDHPLWDTSGYLAESSNLGDVVHSLLGYADRPTVLQAVVWATYLAVSTTAFVMMGRRAKAVRPAAPAPEAPDVASTDPAPVADAVRSQDAAPVTAADPAPGAPTLTGGLPPRLSGGA